MTHVTPELLLSNLPTAITIWTCITLAWGLYMAGCFYNIISQSAASVRDLCSCSKCQYYALWLANVVLAAFLALDHTIGLAFGDAVLVINVFYGAYLACVTKCVVDWYRAKP